MGHLDLRDYSPVYNGRRRARHVKDLASLDEVGDLLKQGKQVKNSNVKAYQMDPMGMTGKQLRSRFAWSKQPDSKDRTLLSNDVRIFAFPLKTKKVV